MWVWPQVPLGGTSTSLLRPRTPRPRQSGLPLPEHSNKSQGGRVGREGGKPTFGASRDSGRAHNSVLAFLGCWDLLGKKESPWSRWVHLLLFVQRFGGCKEQGGHSLFWLRFLHGTIGVVPVLGSDDSSGNRLSLHVLTTEYGGSVSGFPSQNSSFLLFFFCFPKQPLLFYFFVFLTYVIFETTSLMLSGKRSSSSPPCKASHHRRVSRIQSRKSRYPPCEGETKKLPKS